jgi:DNA polymerase-3 subunit delta
MTITLTGPNGFALKRELDQLVATFLKDHDEMGLERLDGEEADFARLQEAVQSLPFLADAKLVILRAAGANKQFAEKAAQVLEGVPETTTLVLVEPKLDKRSSYYKFLKKSTDYREFIELDAGGLARWLSDEAKKQGGALSASDAKYLVDRVGAGQQLLANELDKLLLHDPKIGRQSIELLTDQAPQSTVFNLLEAAFAGQPAKAMALYQEQRTQRVEPQEIIAMLGWQLRVLAAIKAGGSQSADAIAKTAKLSPYVVKKSQSIARRLTPARAKQLIQDLLTIDRRLKRESLDADEMVQAYLLQLAS